VITRKNIEQFAALVREVPEQGCGPEWLANRLGEIIAANNERFDWERWLEACAPIKEERV